MPYAITSDDDNVEAALRRIAREEAEGALAQVRGAGELGPRVHEMRKTVKKLRGLLRLVRPVFPEARAENAVLRDAGQSLSALRDAAVQLSTAERLSRNLPDDRRQALLAPFRTAAEHHDARAEAEMLPPFADVMASLVGRTEHWRLRRKGWDALEPGLAGTWTAARRAMKQAHHSDDPEALHEWRKRAKDHWYQARLLRPIWPEMMDPHVRAADDLGELLGQINDLAVFRERLDAADLGGALRSEAQDLATVRHDELMAQVVPLGRRLFAGRAASLTERWGAWWRQRAA